MTGGLGEAREFRGRDVRGHLSVSDTEWIYRRRDRSRSAPRAGAALGLRSRSVYHSIVRRVAASNFERRLSQGEWRPLVRQLAPDVHHVFPGDNPLGGERRSRQAVEQWFERLGRLFPGHTFTVQHIVSRGWPWSTWVIVSWEAELRPQVGSPYRNSGTHWIHLRWGKVTYFHAYLDTAAIAEACHAMAAVGVDEAAAPPISD